MADTRAQKSASSSTTAELLTIFDLPDALVQRIVGFVLDPAKKRAIYRLAATCAFFQRMCSSFVAWSPHLGLVPADALQKCVPDVHYFYIATDDLLARQMPTFDLIKSNVGILHRHRPKSYGFSSRARLNLPLVCIREGSTIAQLMELLVRSYGGTGDSLWLWIRRENKTFRLDSMIATKGAQGRRSIELALSQDAQKKGVPPLQLVREEAAVPILYLGREATSLPDSISGDPGAVEIHRSGGTILLFVKFFEAGCLRLAGTHVADQSDTLLELVPALQRLCSLGPTEEIEVFEEVEYKRRDKGLVIEDMCEQRQRFIERDEPEQPCMLAEGHELQNGDILIVQRTRRAAGDPFVVDFMCEQHKKLPGDLYELPSRSELARQAQEWGDGDSNSGEEVMVEEVAQEP